MESVALTESFVRNFILKDKRERALFELLHPVKRTKFINRLNHKWADVFDMQKLQVYPRM